MTNKKYLSHTQLDMLSKCGEMYYQRYVRNRKIPPGIAALVGRTIDDTVTPNLQGVIDDEPLKTVEEIEDLAADAFRRQWESSDISLTDEDLAAGIKITKDKALDKSVVLSKLHAEKVAPTIRPTHVQRRIVAELPGYDYDLVGYLDVQEGVETVRDTKTSGKTPNRDIADKDDQLTSYSMLVYVADGVIPVRLCLDYLIDVKGRWSIEVNGEKISGKGPKPQTFSTTRTKQDFNPILRRIERASLVLESGAFMPARESDWWCDPKWCGYYPTCKYVKGIGRK
jgi:hypothetical protein